MVYYLSLTGNVSTFVQKLGSEIPSQDISESSLKMVSGSVFISPTTGCGDPPDEAMDFLRENSKNISFLVGSGDTNFGDSYCGGIDIMSKEFGIPVFMKFELDGTDEDVILFKEKYMSSSEISK